MTAEMIKTDVFSYGPKFQTVTVNRVSATRLRVHDHLTSFLYKSDKTNM